MTTILDGRVNPVTSDATRCDVSGRTAVVHLLDDVVTNRGASAAQSWTTLVDQDPKAVAFQQIDVVAADYGMLKAKTKLPGLAIELQSESGSSGWGILFPKQINSRHLGGLGPSFQLRGCRLVGNRFLQVPQGEAALDDLNLLLDAAINLVPRFGEFLLIEDVDQESRLWQEIQRREQMGDILFAPHGFQPRRRIRLPQTAAEYWDHQFSKKTLSTFRRKLKKFGKTELVRITDRGQIHDFLLQAHHISQDTWQTRQFGLRVRNDDAERAQMGAMADRGLLRSYLWLVEGSPVAFLIGNQMHGCFNYEEVGYKTEYARFSPGQMMLIQTLDDMFAFNRPDWFDFGGGDAEYKQLFATDSSMSGSVWLMPRTWRSRTKLNWLAGCRKLRSSLRSAVTRIGLATRARQWIRYGGATTSNAPSQKDSSKAGAPQAEQEGAD